MSGYLGTTPVNTLDGTPYEGFGPTQWALEYIERYGGIEGDHHRAWVLDQVARIIHGTPVVVKLARWESGDSEYRIVTEEPPSAAYLAWVEDMKGDGEYDYNEGIAP